MGKKGRSNKGGGGALSDDGASAASTCTIASLQDGPSTSGEDLDFADPFERCLEALYEKRSSTRVAALANLVAILERSYSYEDCLYRMETIAQRLLVSVRKGASGEASLAVRGLGLHFLTLGLQPQAEKLLEEVSLALQKLAAATGRDPALRCAALEALAIVAFALIEDAAECRRIGEGLFKVASTEGHTKVAASAIRGWSLLLTCLPGSSLDSAFCDRALQMLMTRLSVTDVELRDAAGEGTALIFSAAGLSQLAGDLKDPSEGGAEDAGGLHEVVQRMKQLATNRGDAARRSKKDRSFLKSSFREHCKAVEGQGLSFDRLKLRDGRMLVIDSLEGQIQLNAFRSFLGTALMPQLEANPLLHDIFGLASDDNSAVQQLNDMGYQVRRVTSNADQKHRSKGRSREQADKSLYAGAVLGAPGFEGDEYVF